jgi:hypothetical protein
MWRLGYVNVTADVDTVLDAIYTNGPLAVAIDASHEVGFDPLTPAYRRLIDSTGALVCSSQPQPDPFSSCSFLS